MLNAKASFDRPPRVLFINPPSAPYTNVVQVLDKKMFKVLQPIAMPMGLLYLSATLERDMPEIEICIVDFAKALRELIAEEDRDPTDFDAFAAKVLAEQVPDDFVPDVIGISILFSTAHRSTGHIADAVKRLWKETPVVVGGMHATNAVESLLNMPSIDFVCRGEGESIIAELVTRMRSQNDPESIQGIIGRKKLQAAGSASGMALESAPLIDDLDEIPLPAWHLLPMSEYVLSIGSRVRRMDAIEQDGEATIVTSRGCPFSCTFCSSWTVHGRKMRFRSAENVVQELEILHERYGVNLVIPEDDLFTVKKTRIIELCNAIANRFEGSISFQFPNGLSVATLDEDVIDGMIRMGMKLANIAIESGSADVQRNIIKKNCDLDRARHVVEVCRDKGIFVRCYFIIGFPGETLEQIEETFAFASSLPSDWNVFNIAAPLIGSEMFGQMLDRGDIDDTYNWDSAFFHERSFDTKEIGAEHLKELVYTSNIKINFFNNHALRTGDYRRAISIFQEILLSYPGHLIAQYCIGLARRGMGDDRGFQESLATCNRMLDDGTSEMPRQHLNEFRDYLPELVDKDFTAGALNVAARPPNRSGQDRRKSI